MNLNFKFLQSGGFDTESLTSGSLLRYLRLISNISDKIFKLLNFCGKIVTSLTYNFSIEKFPFKNVLTDFQNLEFLRKI